jgi:tetratricopeptide (TPR) repeat protein
MIGRFTKRIYVETNDPINPRTAITVSGFIRDSRQTPFTIGKYYFSRGEYDKAIIEFENSIKLDANHTESYYYLGQCYLQKGIIEYNNKNILKAYSLYRKANKFAEQAIPQYEKTIENNPKDLNSYLRLGYIYEVRSIAPFVNDYDKALEYYLKALDLATSSSLAGNTGIIIYLHTRIGYIYFEKKKYSQAIEYLESAIKMSSYNAEAYYYLGLSYDKIGEIEKAREYHTRVIELAPQSEWAQDAEKELKKINKD